MHSEKNEKGGIYYHTLFQSALYSGTLGDLRANKPNHGSAVNDLFRSIPFVICVAVLVSGFGPIQEYPSEPDPWNEWIWACKCRTGLMTAQEILIFDCPGQFEQFQLQIIHIFV